MKKHAPIAHSKTMVTNSSTARPVNISRTRSAITARGKSRPKPRPVSTPRVDPETSPSPEASAAIVPTTVAPAVVIAPPPTFGDIKQSFEKAKSTISDLIARGKSACELEQCVGLVRSFDELHDNVIRLVDPKCIFINVVTLPIGISAFRMEERCKQLYFQFLLAIPGINGEVKQLEALVAGLVPADKAADVQRHFLSLKGKMEQLDAHTKEFVTQHLRTLLINHENATRPRVDPVRLMREASARAQTRLEKSVADIHDAIQRTRHGIETNKEFLTKQRQAAQEAAEIQQQLVKQLEQFISESNAAENALPSEQDVESILTDTLEESCGSRTDITAESAKRAGLPAERMRQKPVSELLSMDFPATDSILEEPGAMSAPAEVHRVDLEKQTLGVQLKSAEREILEAKLTLVDALREKGNFSGDYKDSLQNLVAMLVGENK